MSRMKHIWNDSSEALADALPATAYRLRNVLGGL